MDLRGGSTPWDSMDSYEIRRPLVIWRVRVLLECLHWRPRANKKTTGHEKGLRGQDITTPRWEVHD